MLLLTGCWYCITVLDVCTTPDSECTSRHIRSELMKMTDTLHDTVSADTQMVRFPAFVESRGSPTADHWTLSWVTIIHSTLSHYKFLRSTLMLSCHSHLGHPYCFFHSNPCYSSAYYSPASDWGGPGSNPDQSSWDFSWAKWYWDNTSPST